METKIDTYLKDSPDHDYVWDPEPTDHDLFVDKMIEFWTSRQEKAQTREYWTLCQLNILLYIESSLQPIKNENEEGRRELWKQRKKAKRIEHLIYQLKSRYPRVMAQHEVN